MSASVPLLAYSSVCESVYAFIASAERRSFTSLHCPIFTNCSALSSSSSSRNRDLIYAARTAITNLLRLDSFCLESQLCLRPACALLDLQLVSAFSHDCWGVNTLLNSSLASAPKQQQHRYTHAFRNHGRPRPAAQRRLKLCTYAHEQPGERCRATPRSQSHHNWRSDLASLTTKNPKHRATVRDINLPRLANSPFCCSLRHRYATHLHSVLQRLSHRQIQRECLLRFRLSLARLYRRSAFDGGV